MSITDVKYIRTVITFKISLVKTFVIIDIKKNKQTIKMRDKIGIMKFNFFNSLTISNRYRLNKIVKANNKGRIIL